jgi:hypothetical protein
MAKKTPKEKQRDNRAYAQRKREKGFVRVQLWTPPEGRASLQTLAKALRQEALAARTDGGTTPG